jgi:hypothetical protein
MIATTLPIAFIADTISSDAGWPATVATICVGACVTMAKLCFSHMKLEREAQAEQIMELHKYYGFIIEKKDAHIESLHERVIQETTNAVNEAKAVMKAGLREIMKKRPEGNN